MTALFRALKGQSREDAVVAELGVLLTRLKGTRTDLRLKTLDRCENLLHELRKLIEADALGTRFF